MAHHVTNGAKISDGARLLLQRIRAYMRGKVSREKGYAYPSIEELAGDMGKSVATVKRRVRELKAAGLLQVDRPDRRYRNQYRLADGSEVSPPPAQKCAPGQLAFDPPDGSEVTPPTAQLCALPMKQETESQREEQKPTAAAAVASLRQKAEQALAEAGIEQPLRSQLAWHDPELVLLVVEHWQAKCARVKNPPEAGYIVTTFRKARDRGFERIGPDTTRAEIQRRGLRDHHDALAPGQALAWLLPHDSPGLATRGKAAIAQRVAVQVQERQQESRAAALTYQELRENARMAWSILDEPERRGIERAVRVKMASMSAGDPAEKLPGLFRDACENLALELEEASQDLAKWQTVPVAEREAAIALATEEWPLFMQGDKRLWACWMALAIVRRRKK